MVARIRSLGGKKGFQEYSLQIMPCFCRSFHKHSCKNTNKQLFGNPDAPLSATAMFWGTELVCGPALKLI